jgi:hypothetical protein
MKTIAREVHDNVATASRRELVQAIFSFMSINDIESELTDMWVEVDDDHIVHEIYRNDDDIVVDISHLEYYYCECCGPTREHDHVEITYLDIDVLRHLVAYLDLRLDTLCS